MRVFAAILLAGLALLGSGAAQAQFFPFFDNRPSPPRVRPPAPHKTHPRPNKRRAHAEPPRAAAAAAPAAPAEPVAEGPPPPFEPQMLRLSEIMGALAVLDGVCEERAKNTDKNTDFWRETMEKLLDAQEAAPARRERLAGAYNRGFNGYLYSYRQCTPSADVARRRFHDEGAAIAHDISAQYREN